MMKVQFFVILLFIIIFFQINHHLLKTLNTQTSKRIVSLFHGRNQSQMAALQSRTTSLRRRVPVVMHGLKLVLWMQKHLASMHKVSLRTLPTYSELLLSMKKVKANHWKMTRKSFQKLHQVTIQSKVITNLNKYSSLYLTSIPLKVIDLSMLYLFVALDY